MEQLDLLRYVARVIEDIVRWAQQMGLAEIWSAVQEQTNRNA
jgi:hypothetical protein